MATILIVDDLPANRTFLVTLLAHHGHHVIEAGDGHDALALVRSERPELVITDVLMPTMDGYELVKQMRMDPDGRGDARRVLHRALRRTRGSLAREVVGVLAVLTKPALSADVLKIVNDALAGTAPAAPAAVPARQAIESDRHHLRLMTDKLSEKSDNLRIANARLRGLVNLCLELASDRSFEERLRNLCASAGDLFGACYVTLGIVESIHGTVKQIVTSGGEVAAWTSPGDPVAGVLRSVVAERRPIWGDNPGGDPATLELPVLHPDVHSYMAVPIVSSTQVHGWLSVVGAARGAFAEEDTHLLAALASQVGRIYELERAIAQAERGAAALHASDERAQFAFEAANVGVWDMDYVSGQLRWSETLQAQYGFAPGTFPETLDAFFEVVHPLDRDQLRETVATAVRTGQDFKAIHRLQLRDGSVRWVSGAGRIYLDERGRAVRGVGLSLDVTEQQALQQQVQQAQAQEDIGRLTSGVAHDFNNLLTIILGYCEVLLGDMAPADGRRIEVIEIQKAGERATALTRRLRAFNSTEAVEPTLLAVNEVVADIPETLERLLRDDVSLALALSSDVSTIRMDRRQLEQILLNLTVDAQAAMPDGGTVTLATTALQVDGPESSAGRELRAGSYAVLTVSAAGAGLTTELQAQLFEPLFAPKEIGGGAGFGLGALQRSLTAHTGFSVYLPAIVKLPPSTVGGRPTVLVVEDLDALRELTRRLLVRQGYRVIVAANALEAIPMFEQHQSIDLLLTDVVMPGSSGPELTQQLLVNHPHLKVIYMSGYTDEAMAKYGVLDPGVAFLHKPFTSEALGAMIREVLAGNSAASALPEGR
ncbi:MAG TPA: response regulator [Vicinamibacterales bacterium]|nr:response regulator [Vicinamibacterales bacterium]